MITHDSGVMRRSFDRVDLPRSAVRGLNRLAMLNDDGKSRDQAKATNPLCGCSQIVPSYDIVNVGSVEKGYRALCGKCFNTEMAKLDGLDRFEHVTFEPVRLADCTGKTHEFHFRTHLFGTGVALDAFELRDGHPAGYQFQIIGDPQEDLLVLLGRLIEKMRRGLSVKHVSKGESRAADRGSRVVRGNDRVGRFPGWLRAAPQRRWS